jgi:hypothetical protein
MCSRRTRSALLSTSTYARLISDNTCSWTGANVSTESTRTLVLPAFVRLRFDAGRRVEIAALDLRVVGQGEERFGARRERAFAGRDPIQLLEALA